VILKRGHVEVGRTYKYVGSRYGFDTVEVTRILLKDDIVGNYKYGEVIWRDLSLSFYDPLDDLKDLVDITKEIEVNSEVKDLLK